LTARAALANDQVGEEAVAAAPVERVESLRATPADDPLAGGVGGRGGEQAVRHRDDLVPATRGVKAAGQPAARVLAEGVLELVAIPPLLLGGQDRFELEALEPADPPQGIGDLRLLDLQLVLV